ncbi:hypothetical protein C8R43DRAFT_1124071 [Mycena crocata]|nr:hypothetical protein C8R43DRAFT_1124071 [Mycena crocata]
MSSAKKSRRRRDPLSEDELKHQHHAEAQRRYRARNLDETRIKARERMEKLRETRTPEQARAVAKRRRRHDADYREQQRAQKFREKFGQEAFFGFYHPQYKLTGQRHLPGLYFGADDQAELNRLGKVHQREVEKKKKTAEKTKASKAGKTPTS